MNVWRVVRVGILVCGLGTAVLGCGGGGDEPKTISATEVCDGRVSSAAAESVEFLTGTKELSPSGNNHSDVTLPEAAAALADGYVPGGGGDPVPKPACWVVNPKGGSADLSVAFGTTTAKAADGPAADTLTKYDVGRAAFAGVARTYLYFDCVSSKLPGSTREQPAVVRGELTNDAEGKGRYQPKGGPEKVGEANLTVLHSLSLGMAKELGCAGNGGLETKLTLKPAGN